MFSAFFLVSYAESYLIFAQELTGYKKCNYLIVHLMIVGYIEQVGFRSAMSVGAPTAETTPSIET